MTRVGCTGHQALGPATRRLIAAAIAEALTNLNGRDLVGLTSLAEGADQVFAFAVLAAGGRLQAVIPSQSYEQSFQSDPARQTYGSLLDLAASRTTLTFSTPSEDAYLAAGHHIADNCDVLLAIWDGQEAAGKGGTGDVVAYARSRGRETQVIWPPGSSRT